MPAVHLWMDEKYRLLVVQSFS